MNTTIKEVKKKISRMENTRNNLLNLQEFFLCHLRTIEDTEVKNIAVIIEEAASLNTNARTLCTEAILIIDAEIARLNELIDSASIKI